MIAHVLLCREKIRVPATKTCIRMQGEGLDITRIAWNDTAACAHGTWHSASVSIEASNFVANNISFVVTKTIPFEVLIPIKFTHSFVNVILSGLA
mgnify:FL=1